MSAAAPGDLAAAVRLSHEAVQAADSGDMQLLGRLDARRLEHLKAFRSSVGELTPAVRALLQEIATLNEKALGLVEHHRRSKWRALDLAATGRRAVNAYASNGAPR